VPRLNSNASNLFFSKVDTKEINLIQTEINNLLIQKQELITKQKAKHKILCLGCDKKVLLTKCNYLLVMYSEDGPYTGLQWFGGDECYIQCPCGQHNRFYNKETATLLAQQTYAKRGRLYRNEIVWDK
jgi:hypothetical protein